MAGSPANQISRDFRVLRRFYGFSNTLNIPVRFIVLDAYNMRKAARQTYKELG